MLSTTAIVATLALGPASEAARKASPPPGPFVPEIGYVYYGTSGKENYSDIRLANLEGTQAILVYRSSRGGAKVALGPRDQRTILILERDADRWNVRLTRWHQEVAGGPVRFDEPVIIHSYRSLLAIDMAPDGQSFIAYEGDGTGDNHYMLRRYSMTGQFMNLVADFPHGGPVSTWTHSSDGSQVYFTQPLHTGSISYDIVHSVPADGSAPPTQLFVERNVESIDVPRATGPNAQGMILGLWREGFSPTFKLGWWDSLVPQDPSAQGNLSFYPTGIASLHAHYNCANSQFIYEVLANRRSFAIFDIASATSRLWATDQNLRWTDWMPCGLPSPTA